LYNLSNKPKTKKELRNVEREKSLKSVKMLKRVECHPSVSIGKGKLKIQSVFFIKISFKYLKSLTVIIIICIVVLTS